MRLLFSAWQLNQNRTMGLILCLLFSLLVAPTQESQAMTFAGKYPPGPSKLNGPFPVAVSDNGTVYYNDYYSSSIVEVFSDGTEGLHLKTNEVQGREGISNSPYNGIAIAPNGDIYAIALYSDLVVQFHPDGTLVRTWGGEGTNPGQLYGPSSIAISPSGSVYVGDYGSGGAFLSRVQQFTLEGSFVRQWTWDGYVPNAIAVGPNGDIYVNDRDELYRFSSDGTLLYSFDVSEDILDDIFGWAKSVYGLLVAFDGSLYIAESGLRTTSNVGSPHCGIHHLHGNGTYIETLGQCGNQEGAFSFPKYLAWHSDGSMIITDYNNRITRMTTDGTVLECWGSGGEGILQFNQPYDIAFAPDGSFYVADTANHRIKHHDAQGNYIREWGVEGIGDGEFDEVIGVAVAPDSTVYTLDKNLMRVQQFTAEGAFIRAWGEQGSASGQFSSPQDIIVASDGEVLVADSYNDRIQRFQADGTYRDSISISRPFAVDMTRDGEIVAGTYWGEIAILDKNGVPTRQWSTDNYVWGVAVAHDKTIFVGDRREEKILRYSFFGELIEEVGTRGYLNGEFDAPVKLDIKDNEVYVVDSNINRVQYFSFTPYAPSGAIVPSLLLLDE